MKSNKLFALVFFLLTGIASGQNGNTSFTFPVKPGQLNTLSANMGELRANHFHGGYDIKTDQKIGLSVYASQDGYVSRIKVSSYGYGNVVYITHPGNLQTVYAHLDKFNATIEEYLLKKQYEAQSFQVDLYLKPSELPIKKGEIIGLAGNSGSSQGPHLHYEVRDTTDRVLNPSDFKFKEIQDNLPPIFQQVGILPLDINARINGEFSRQEFHAVKSGNIYTLASKVNAGGLLGLELKAIDKKNHAHNSYGINYIQVYLDNNLIFTHNLHSFTFDETRYINEHINYPLWAATGKRFERLYVADGTKLSTYQCTDALRGRILIKDTKIHKVTIKVRDDFNIESTLNFDIQGTETKNTHITQSTGVVNQGLATDIIENTLKVSTKATTDPGTFLYFKGTAMPLTPAYSKTGSIVYLYDLRKGLPDSVKAGVVSGKFHFVKMVPSVSEQKVQFENTAVTFPAGCLADTVYLQMKKEMENGRVVYHVHNNTVSLYDSMHVSITPEENVSDKSHTHVYSVNKGKLSFEGGRWSGNKVEFKTRNLGKFALAMDTTQPSIRFLNNYANSIQFRIGDDLSGIKSFRATLDGYWILMNYDHKRNLLWSERLDKRVPLKGDFRLEVVDNAGNSSIFTLNL